MIRSRAGASRATRPHSPRWVGMFARTMSLVAALLGLAAASPAQFRIEGQIGPVTVGALFGDHCRPKARVRVDDCREPRGHWRTVTEQVWVPGYWQEEHVPARWGWVCDPCGHRRRVMLEPERCHRVWVEGRYECRTRRVWVSC